MSLYAAWSSLYVNDTKGESDGFLPSGKRSSDRSLEGRTGFVVFSYDGTAAHNSARSHHPSDRVSAN